MIWFPARAEAKPYWQMHTKPKELGRPNWPYAWQDPELAAAGVRNVTALRFGCNASK